MCLLVLDRFGRYSKNFKHYLLNCQKSLTDRPNPDQTASEEAV